MIHYFLLKEFLELDEIFQKKYCKHCFIKIMPQCYLMKNISGNQKIFITWKKKITIK